MAIALLRCSMIAMIKKGSSRKGQRRRRGTTGSDWDDDVSSPTSAVAEEPVKLDLATTGILREIARIPAKLPELAPTTPRQTQDGESTWGGQHSVRQLSRIWAAFIGVIVVMFLAIAWVNRQVDPHEDNSPTVPGGFVVVSEDEHDDSPLYAFLQNSYQKQQKALAIFRLFTAATKRDQVIPLIRMTDTTPAMLEKYWQPWPSPPLLDQSDALQYEFEEADGRAFLRMTGKNQDGSSFAAFFVEVEGELTLDWEATLEVGDARLATLARNPTEHPVKMRVILTPSPYYLPYLPESEYESYQITSSRDETIVWGYVKRHSPTHEKIRAALLQDVQVLDQMTEARVTIRMQKTADISSQNRFFITEMLHKDWVMP